MAEQLFLLSWGIRVLNWLKRIPNGIRGRPTPTTQHMNITVKGNATVNITHYNFSGGERGVLPNINYPQLSPPDDAEEQPNENEESDGSA